MSSDADIANLALSFLGDDATVSSIDPPEGSAQAEHCARFYPIARDALLQMHAWGIATRRVTGAARTSETTSWGFAYVKPADCLQMIAVLPPNSPDDYAAPNMSLFEQTGVSSALYAMQLQTQPYEQEALADGTPVIYTDQENAELRYIARVTDPTRFSPLFVVALARLLAHFMAGPVIKGDAGRAAADDQYKKFLIEFGKAAAQDSNASHRVVKAAPSWIAGR